MGLGVYTKNGSLFLEDAEIANSNTNQNGLAAKGAQLSFNGTILQEAEGGIGLIVDGGALTFNGQDVSYVDKLNVSLEEFNKVFLSQSYNNKKPYYITEDSSDVLEYANTTDNNGKVRVSTDVYGNVDTDIPSYGEICSTKDNIVASFPDTAVYEIWLNGSALSGANQVVQLASSTGVVLNNNRLVFGKDNFYVPKKIYATYERASVEQDEVKTITATLNEVTKQFDVVFPQSFYMFKEGWEEGYSLADSTNVVDEGDKLQMYPSDTSVTTSLTINFTADTRKRLVVFIKAIVTNPDGNTQMYLKYNGATVRQNTGSDASMHKMREDIGYGVKSVAYKNCNNGGNTQLSLVINHGVGILTITEIGVMLWS